MSLPNWFTPKNVIIFFAVAILIAAGAAGTYLAEQLYFKPIREQRVMIENLKELVERLTKEERVAEVVVLEQGGEPLKTTFSWVEIDEQGKKLGAPRQFAIEGKEAYFDSLVITFENNFNPYNEMPLKQKDIAEHLAKKSLIIFRRIFGAQQKPADGFPLDLDGEAPLAYRGATPLGSFEQKLWNEFWVLSNNPELAKERGVRAAHGLAVSQLLEKGKTYVIERRLTGNLSIRPKP